MESFFNIARKLLQIRLQNVDLRRYCESQERNG